MDATGQLAAIVDHALTSGLFERVNAHEPKASPGSGLTAAVWAQDVGPVPNRSGLAATSARVVWNVRLYTSMLAQPEDAIDPNLLAATDTLLTAYSGDFTLGGLISHVDLLGQAGETLRAVAGYLEQDHKLYRVMTIFLPVIVNDAWEQVA